MKTIRERVELPDASVQPLVHPLDLPGSHRTFAISWWLGQLASPSVFFALAAVFWAVHDNYVTPILVATVITVCAALASMYYSGEAWAFIPRSRHDRQREAPLTWRVIQAAAITAAMLFGLVLLLGWLIARGFPPEVSAFTAGTIIGIVCIMAVALVWNLAVPTRLRTELTGRIPQLGTGVVLLIAVVYGSATLQETALVEGWQTRDVILGFATILAVQVCWSLIQRIPRASAQPAT